MDRQISPNTKIRQRQERIKGRAVKPIYMGGTREGRKIRQMLREITAGRAAYKYDPRRSVVFYWRQHCGLSSPSGEDARKAESSSWRQQHITDVFNSFDLVSAHLVDSRALTSPLLDEPL